MFLGCETELFSVSVCNSWLHAHVVCSCVAVLYFGFSFVYGMDHFSEKILSKHLSWFLVGGSSWRPFSKAVIFFSFKLYLFFILMCKCFACIYACVPCACLVPLEIRRGCQIPWYWSSGKSWATMWVLESEPGSSTRADHTLNRWAISPTLKLSFSKWLAFTLK